MSLNVVLRRLTITPVTPLIQTGDDRRRAQIWAGSLRPYDLVHDFATLRDVPAISEVALRDTFIAYAVCPERFVRVSWTSADGNVYEARDLGALPHAVRDGVLLPQHCVRIDTTSWWIAVSRDELLSVLWPPKQPMEPSWLERWWPALAVGGLAVAGTVAFVVHVRDSRPVDVRDPEERHAIWKRDGRRCAICGGRLTLGHMHLDHRDPVSRGGESTWGNLQATHGPCNQSKGARTMDEHGRG